MSEHKWQWCDGFADVLCAHGFTEEDAMESAIASYGANIWNDPVEAAADHMSYWHQDGKPTTKLLEARGQQRMEGL